MTKCIYSFASLKEQIMYKLMSIILFLFSFYTVFSQSIKVEDDKLTRLYLKQSEIESNWKDCLIEYDKQKFSISICDGNNDSIFSSEDFFNVFHVKSNQQVYSNIKDSLEIKFDIDKYFLITNISHKGDSLDLKVSQKPLLNQGIEFINYLPDIVVNYYLKDGSIKLLDYIPEKHKNKVAIYFWSSSCSPCIKELHLLKELKKNGYFVVNFCCKERSDKEKVKSLISQNNVPGDQFVGGDDMIGELFSQAGFPMLVVFKEGEKYPVYYRNIEVFLNENFDISKKE